MKLSTLLKDVQVQGVYEEKEVERVTDKDSINLENALFICINGSRVDGHSLAHRAIKNGAVAVVTDKDLGLSQQIIVKDTRQAFSEIAGNFYSSPSKKLKLIGITGTNGKTSTAFFIKEILKSLGKKCGIISTVKNYNGCCDENAELTTPEPMELQKLFCEMVENDCEYCVMEVSSQALSQSRVHGLHFVATAITNITPEHLDYHGSMESYIDAKLKLSELSDFMCINIDDDNLQKNINKVQCKTISYSTRLNKADYTAKNVCCNEKGIRYELVGMNCIGRISSELFGKFTVYNSLCAASILLELGFSVDEISKGMAQILPVKGRAEIVDTPKNIRVMIDYAHTPDGLENILGCVREITKGRVITVFGCGGDRDKTKRAEMGRIAGNLSDLAIITSDNPRGENPLLIINDILGGMERSRARLAVIENRREAIEFALKKAKTGDTVLLAGKGHETVQIIGDKMIPFDERDIVREYFR